MQSCSVVEACTGMLIPVCRGSRRVDLPPQLHHAFVSELVRSQPFPSSLPSPLPHPPPSICHRRRPSVTAVGRLAVVASRRRRRIAVAAAVVASYLSPPSLPRSRRPRRRRLAFVASPSSPRRRRLPSRLAVVARRRLAVVA